MIQYKPHEHFAKILLKRDSKIDENGSLGWSGRLHVAPWGPRWRPNSPRGGPIEALGATCRASWGQDGTQDRQKEPQEAQRWPTWRQDEPRWPLNAAKMEILAPY